MAPSRPVLQEFACIASAPLTYLAPLEKALDHRRGPKPNGLSCSASRVAGENGPAVRRACGHAALPRCRTVGPGLPVSRARRVSATPAVFALVCFAVQNDPVTAPASVSGPTACLLASGKPGVKTHTHEYGSISSGWPPNQPASRIAKLFGESWLCGGVSRAHEVAPFVGVALGKLLRPASWRLRRP